MPGRFVAVAVGTDEQWQALARTIGREDLLSSPDLQTGEGRRARSVELDTAVADWTGARTAEDVQGILQEAGVPVHVSASSEDFCTDPQLQHRGHLVTLPHPLFGQTVVEGPRYLLSETPGVVRSAAPTFGQHNRLVLADLLGYDDDRIDRLAAAGVLS